MYFCRSWFSNMVSFRYVLVFLNFLHDIFSIKFYTISFLWDLFTISFTIFLLMRNITRWMLDTEVKVFHESISYFMKWPWNCISWNSLKEKFHSVSFPLESFHIPCPKTLRTAKRIKRYTIPGETLTVPGTMKKNSEFLMRPLEWILRCDPIFSFYIHPFPFKLLKMEVSL